MVTLTTLGTLLMIRLFGPDGDLYAFLVYSPLFLILGEVVPKSVYQQKADSLGPVIVYPLRFFSWLFYPVVFVFSWVARTVARMIGVKVAPQGLFTNRQKIRAVIEMAEQGADIDVFDRGRISRVTSFADKTVSQTMTPTDETINVSIEQSTQQAIKLAREKGYFRLPVYQDNYNQIVGVISLTMWELMNPKLRSTPLFGSYSPLFMLPRQLLDELLQ